LARGRCEEALDLLRRALSREGGFEVEREHAAGVE
jgi:hypothetical protein